MPFYENQPAIYPLYRLLDEVVSGELRVPRFQRPGTEFTWRPEQRGDLLDSIYRGFPIGTVLVWSTSEQVSTLGVVGGAAISPQAKSRKLRLILDGHQRLSTLVAILGPAIDGFQKASGSGSQSLEECWVFDLSEDIGEAAQRFQLLRSGQLPADEQILLSIVLDRLQVNEWVRKRKQLSRTQVKMVDNLRDRLREYSIPVATLAAESLDVATESFKRVNSSGTVMSDFHMVAALAYSRDFDPQQRFEEVREEFLQPTGWSDVEDGDILRICAGLIRLKGGDTSQHPAKLNIEGLGRSLKRDPTLIEQAAKAISKAAKLLGAEAGVYGPSVIPYSWQLIVLAIELGRRPVRLSLQEKMAARKWFWLTTYGAVFSGINSVVVDRAGQALSEMMQGGGYKVMKPYMGRNVGEPRRFDFRAARSRACMLNMARVQDRGRLDGRAHRALSGGSVTVFTLDPKVARSTWFNVAIGTDDLTARQVRDALRDAIEKGELQEGSFLAHFGLRAPFNDIEEALDGRRRYLRQIEKEFVETDVGLEWDVSQSEDLSFRSL